nr:hypothetical protein [uncultured Acetatifactor sp.]
MMRNGMPWTNLENEGLVLAGWMFDDGCHALATGEPVAISSGSDKKEGAWEFLCFLLGDEVQEDYSFDVSVKKSAFTEYVNKLLERIERDNLTVAYTQEFGSRFRFQPRWRMIWGNTIKTTMRFRYLSRYRGRRRQSPLSPFLCRGKTQDRTRDRTHSRTHSQTRDQAHSHICSRCR